MNTDESMTSRAEAILRAMTGRGLTMSTAESCTSGGIAAALTSVDGASEYFQGGIVAYQNGVKVEKLGVSAQDIERYDVVSEPVVRQMVAGACRMFGTDLAVASSGYVGSSTENAEVWIGVGNADKVRTRCLHCPDRKRTSRTEDAVLSALDLILDVLSEE